MKLSFPRFFEGREWFYWVRSVTSNIGTNPPASLEELGAESVVPMLSRISSLEREVETAKKATAAKDRKIQALERRLDDLERSI